jgi:hypothetical protein
MSNKGRKFTEQDRRAARAYVQEKAPAPLPTSREVAELTITAMARSFYPQARIAAILDAARVVWEAEARLAQHVKDYHEQDYRRLGNECQAANLLESALATALENWRKVK